MTDLPIRDVAVLVVGGGPTGLLTANLLGQYGVSTLLVERNTSTSDLPKAILLDDEGFRALQAVTLSEKVHAHVIAGYGARYYAPNGECFAEVDSPVTQNGYRRRNAFLQPDLEKIMHQEGLQRHNCVSALFETTLEGFTQEADQVLATLTDRDGAEFHVNCQFLLACDGARSTVREQLDIAMEGRTDSRDWVVIDTRNDPDADRFSKFFCDPARPVVSIPAPNRGRRYEFMVLPGEDSTQMAYLARVREVLDHIRDFAEDDIVRCAVYTFHARVADRLVVNRVALLGDAAHLSPPFAGQGMNAGLRDAFNAAWKVALCVGGKAGPAILGTYETERRQPIIDMIDYAVSLGEIVMPTGGVDEAAKRAIREVLMGDSVPDGEISAMKPKPNAAYETGWLCRGGDGDDDLTGHVLAQPKVATKTGDEVRLDDVLGPWFSLIGIGEAAVDVLNALDQGVWKELQTRRVVLLCATETATDSDDLRGCTLMRLPLDGDFHLTAQTGRVLLVRPDRFVAGWCDLETAVDFAASVRQQCRSASKDNT